MQLPIVFKFPHNLRTSFKGNFMGKISHGQNFSWGGKFLAGLLREKFYIGVWGRVGCKSYAVFPLFRYSFVARKYNKILGHVRIF